MMQCITEDCDNLPNFRFTWPGKDETYSCLPCSLNLANVSQAIGLHLQLILLTADDYMRLMERKVE